MSKESMSEEAPQYGNEPTYIVSPPQVDGMSLNEYQRFALETAVFPTDKNISYLALALCGECGEVANKVKKVLRDKNGQFYAPDIVAIALELGDVLWYIANLARFLGYGLSDIAMLNIEKIQGRIERGTLQGIGDNR